MLLRWLFLALLLASLAEGVLHGVHALAQAAVHRRAALAVRQALETATAQAGDALASAIAAGADPRWVAPSPPPVRSVCTLRTRRGCVINTSVRIAFVSSEPLPSPSACPDDTCATYRQGNDTALEGAAAAVIRAIATGGGGRTLSERAIEVRWRTWPVQPYAALTGGASGADVAIPRAGDTGDDAGTTPQGQSNGTLLHVRFQNALTGKSIPADVWERDRAPTLAPPPAWPP